MGLNDCDRILRCEFSAHHEGPCSFEVGDATGASLSERLRPGVEAAPWVIAEVRKLEARIEYLTKQIQREDI